MQDGVPPVGTAPAVNSSAQSPDYDDMGREVLSNNTPRMPSLLHQDQRTEASRSLPTAPSLLQPGASSAAANARDQRLLEIMDNPPAPRGGIRGKLGGFFDALGWNQIGDTLKNPGLSTYQADLSRAQQQADIANRAALRDQSIANQQSQRQDYEARTAQTNLSNKRTAYDRLMTDITNRGGFEAPTIPPSITTVTIPADPTQPLSPINIPTTQRTFDPGLQPQQSSGLGTVQQLTDPDTGETRNMVRPNPAVQQEMTGLPATQEMIDKFGLPPGTKLPKATYDTYAVQLQKGKDAANKPPTAAQAKATFQGTMSKLQPIAPRGALTDMDKMVDVLTAGVQRGLISDQEARDAWGYMATNTTTPGTASTGVQRGLAIAQNRLYASLDAEAGNAPRFVTPPQVRAEPNRFQPSGPTVAALKPTALLEDIRGNIGQVRQDLKNLPEFTVADKAKIAVALRNRNPSSAISSLLTSGALSTLGPQQQQYLIDLAQLHENAMAMRGQLGAGQGSDDLRAAITATIPGPTTPSNAYASQQLNAFENVLNRLERGIPAVNLRPQRGAGASRGGGIVQGSKGPVDPRQFER